VTLASRRGSTATTGGPWPKSSGSSSAPNGPETVIVGHERAYLSWFYDRVPSSHDGVGPAIDEYARTFSGTEGVLGALGVYRAAFRTIDQTEPLAGSKVSVPVIAVGGALSRGDQVRERVETVAETVTGVVIPGCGHFVPEERPDRIVELVLGLTGPPARHKGRRLSGSTDSGQRPGPDSSAAGAGHWPVPEHRAGLAQPGDPLRGWSFPLLAAAALLRRAPPGHRYR
jgi:hypothetical protein